MRKSISSLLLLFALLLGTGCMTIRPGESAFRFVSEGYASQRPGEPWETTKKRADTYAKNLAGDFIAKNYEARKKFAGLLGKSIDDPIVIQFANNAPIVKRTHPIEAGIRMAYSYAVVPFAAPSAFVSGGLSLLFPGLGQMHINSQSIGYIAAGAIGAGLTIYNYLQYDSWNQKYLRADQIDLINEYYDEANRWYKYAQISAAGYGIITIFSSVQASTLAKSNQRALDTILSGGVKIGDNTKLMIIPSADKLTVSLYYGF